MHNKKPWLVAGICVGLVGLIWFAFGQSAHFPFVNYDDPAYTYENPAVAGGLSWPGVVWDRLRRLSRFGWQGSGTPGFVGESVAA